MSTDHNRQTIDRVYAAFAAKDMDTILSLQTEDVEWSVAGPTEIPWAAPGTGKDAVVSFVKTLGASIQVEHIAMDHTFVDGDKVVVLGHQNGRTTGAGKPYSIDFVHVWTLVGGKISKFRVYYDTAHMVDALRADS